MFTIGQRIVVRRTNTLENTDVIFCISAVLPNGELLAKRETPHPLISDYARFPTYYHSRIRLA